MPVLSFEEEIFKGEFNIKTIARIFREALKHKKLFFGFIFFITLTSVGEALGTDIIKNIIDKGIIPKNNEIFLTYIRYYGLLHIGIALTVFLFIYCSGSLNHILQYQLRKRAFAHLQNLSFSFFDISEFLCLPCLKRLASSLF